MHSAAEIPSGYKQTEVGVIPDDWHISTVGDEFEIQLGKMLDTEKNVGILKPYLGNKAVQWNHIDVTDLSEMAMSPADLQRYRLLSGDLLVCEGGEVGRASIWNDPIPECYYQKALHRLRPKRGFDRHLMVAFLHYWSEHGLLANHVTQTSIAHLTREKFEAVPLPIPPLSEQHAIATALSDIDALLANLDQLIAKKRDIKQSTMQELLTGQTRLPGFCGEWKGVRAGEIGRFRGGSGFPTKFQGKTSGQYPFFKVSDMNNEGNFTFMQYANNYISEDLRKQIGATLFPAKSIVFAKVGAAVFLERKKILSQPSCIDNNMAAYVIDNNVADHRFFYYVFLNINLGDLVNTTALPSLSGGVLSAIEFSIPSISEQIAIAAILSDMDTEIAALQARHDKIGTLKQGMMQELLTGRIRLV